MGSAFGQNDARLQKLADDLHVVVASVDHGLSPEHQYPVPVEDCLAAALWLAGDDGAQCTGTRAMLAGGESAGAHLLLSVFLRLRALAATPGQAHLSPSSLFRCVNLVYGWYDLGGTPSMLRFSRRLVMNNEELHWYAEQYVPDAAQRLRKAGPDGGGTNLLYSDLDAFPPALFTVGTADPLLDDTLFMAARWAAAGLDADLEVYPGAAHGIGHFGPHQHSEQGPAITARINAFLDRFCP